MAAFSRRTDEVCFFEVIGPKGEQVFTQEGRTSDFGTAAGEILTQSYWPLGTYTLNMTLARKLLPRPPPAAKGRRGRRRRGAGAQRQGGGRP